MRTLAPRELRKRPMPRRDGSYRCLHLDKPGLPEIYLWPGLSIMTPEGTVTPDHLLCAREGERTVWGIIEIDEDGVPTPDSRKCERLLSVPTIRVTDDDLRRLDFMDRLIARIRVLLTDLPADDGGKRHPAEPETGPPG